MKMTVVWKRWRLRWGLYSFFRLFLPSSAATWTRKALASIHLFYHLWRQYLSIIQQRCLYLRTFFLHHYENVTIGNSLYAKSLARSHLQSLLPSSFQQSNYLCTGNNYQNSRCKQHQEIPQEIVFSTLSWRFWSRPTLFFTLSCAWCCFQWHM